MRKSFCRVYGLLVTLGQVLGICLIVGILFVLLTGYNIPGQFPLDDFGGSSIELSYEAHSGAEHPWVMFVIWNVDSFGRPLIMLDTDESWYIVRYGGGSYEEAKKEGRVLNGGLTRDEYAYLGVLKKGQSIGVNMIYYDCSAIGKPIIFSRVINSNGVERETILKEVIFKPD